MGWVFVVGSINMDVVVMVDCYLCVGEIVVGCEVLYFLGGKGVNQVVVVVWFGVMMMLIGWLGKDVFGVELCVFLGVQGIDFGLVCDVEIYIGIVIIMVVVFDNIIVVVFGSNVLVGVEDVVVVLLVRGDVVVS